jgi:hypothetical protein
MAYDGFTIDEATLDLLEKAKDQIAFDLEEWDMDESNSKQKQVVGRWETRGKRYWIELVRDARGFSYRSDNGGGNLGAVPEAKAIAIINKKVQQAKAIDRINYKRVIGEAKEDAKMAKAEKKSAQARMMRLVKTMPADMKREYKKVARKLAKNDSMANVDMMIMTAHQAGILRELDLVDSSREWMRSVVRKRKLAMKFMELAKHLGLDRDEYHHALGS